MGYDLVFVCAQKPPLQSSARNPKGKDNSKIKTADMLGRNGGSKSQRMRKREGFEVFQNGSAVEG